MATTFTITCYGKAKTYKETQRKKMTQEFRTAMLACDGSEAERPFVAQLQRMGRYGQDAIQHLEDVSHGVDALD